MKQTAVRTSSGEVTVNYDPVTGRVQVFNHVGAQLAEGWWDSGSECVEDCKGQALSENTWEKIDDAVYGLWSQG